MKTEESQNSDYLQSLNSPTRASLVAAGIDSDVINKARNWCALPVFRSTTVGLVFGFWLGTNIPQSLDGYLNQNRFILRIALVAVLLLYLLLRKRHETLGLNIRFAKSMLPPASLMFQCVGIFLLPAFFFLVFWLGSHWEQAISLLLFPLMTVGIYMIVFGIIVRKPKGIKQDEWDDLLRQVNNLEP